MNLEIERRDGREKERSCTRRLGGANHNLRAQVTRLLVHSNKRRSSDYRGFCRRLVMSFTTRNSGQQPLSSIFYWGSSEGAKGRQAPRAWTAQRIRQSQIILPVVAAKAAERWHQPWEKRERAATTGWNRTPGKVPRQIGVMESAVWFPVMYT